MALRQEISRWTARSPLTPGRLPIATGGLQGAAANVTEVYSAFASDIACDTWTDADFDHAASLFPFVSARHWSRRNGDALRFTVGVPHAH